MVFDERTRALAEERIGAFEVLANHRGDSARTGVIEISAQGQRLFVKIHNRLNRWNPEVFAYSNWTPRVGAFAPTMVAQFNDGEVFGIVTTALVGRTVNEVGLRDEEKLLAVYRAAGEVLRAMQSGEDGTFFGTPSAEGGALDVAPATAAVAYITNSLQTLFALGSGKELFNDAHERLLTWCLDNCEVFRGDAPMPTNWDYSPNNWLVDDGGRFTGVIDFENMLWGLPLDSFGVVVERYTFDKPRLQAAFFEGYSLPSDAETEIKMRILRAKVAFADVYTGFVENNARFSELGNRMLSELTQDI